MAEKRKNCGDNASSRKKLAHTTHTFETKMDILKCIDNGGHGKTARSLGLSRSTVSTVVKNRDKIMEYVKSAGSFKSVMVNPKHGVLIEEIEHLLKIWLDDQAQKRIPVSQAIISIKAKSLYDNLKKHIGESVTDESSFSESHSWFDRFKRPAICIISNLVVRLQVPTMMLRQLILHNGLN
jgi:hypothetical protein